METSTYMEKSTAPDDAKPGVRSDARRVLVFPAATEIGLEIYNALKDCAMVDIYGAGQAIPNHAELIYPNFYHLCSLYEPGFATELGSLVDRLGIQYILPAFDDAIVELVRLQPLLGAKVVAPSLHLAELTRSKLATYRALSRTVPTPRVYPDANEIPHYPVIVKPDRGQGSFGVSKVSNREELDAAMRGLQSPLICEYLPGEEFTVDCFSDRDRGLLFAGARLRRRMRNGISVNTVTVESVEAAELALRIGSHLGLHGAWFFQARRSAEGRLTLLEVAPRIAGSMAAHRVQGVNFPLLSILEEERLPIAIRTNPGPVVLDRALGNRFRHRISFRTLYLDLDDTLLLAGKVNLAVIELVFQCINDGKKVILLTRHRSDLDATLRLHRLSGLFDEVIHLRQDEPKSTCVLDDDAIFVDDSFSERMDVWRVRGIPTFDASMIELLTKGQFDADL